MDTLLDLFASFRDRGERTALIHRTGVRRFQWSYRELAETSDRMNGWLAAQGVLRGDRVVLWAPNSPWWVVVFWGIIARGAIVVPVDFMSGRDRAETIARLTNARLVVQSRFKPEQITERQAVQIEELEFLIAEVEPLPQVSEAAPGDTAQLIYTSGTTGNPKGVVLTHGNLMSNLLQVNEHVSIVTADFAFLSLLPLSHMFEQMGGFFTPLYNGSSIVYLRTLKPSAIMEALGEEDVQVVIAVPRLLQLLKNSIERELAERGVERVFRCLLNFSPRLGRRLRKALFLPVHHSFGRNFAFFISGGAPLSPELFHFWNALGFTIIEGYGLTECSPVLSANTVDLQIPGSVGLPLHGVGLKLVEGEIVARGPNVFPGYYDNEKATAEVFTADGWFRTGDLGEFDEFGFLHVKGRSKELIVTGAGINVYPDEIEAVLNPLRGVRESCVLGLDRGGGEEVHAVLLLDGSGRPADDIIAEANAELDQLHQITGFTLWPDAEFPKTTTLKIRKFQVRERIARGPGGTGDVVSDRLVSVIAQVTGTPPSDVREEAYLVRDIGLTSIGRLELVNMLEQEYRLDLEDSLIGPQTRVRDLRRMIERRDKLALRDRFRFWTNGSCARRLRQTADAFLHYPLFRSFVTLRVEGIENLPQGGPVLFISNHMSYFDQPAIMLALPRRWRYNTATAAWAEFFFSNFHTLPQRLWKWFTYQYGSVFLNLFPLPQTDGFRRTIAFMGRLADNGINILVFPEGERSPDGRLLPFRQGLGVMVPELSLPVVPVKIRGLERVFPRGARWPKRGGVTVSFGKPLVFRNEGAAEIVARARRAVEEL